MPSHPFQTCCNPTAVSNLTRKGPLSLLQQQQHHQQQQHKSLLPHQSSQESGSNDSSYQESSRRLRSALSDQAFSQFPHQDMLQSGAIRWHSYCGPPPHAGSLFDNENSTIKTASHKVPSTAPTTSPSSPTNKKARSISPTRCIFTPNCRFVYIWTGVVCLACLYNLWIIPYRFTFDEIRWASMAIWFTLDYTCDLIYVLDLFTGSRTAFLQNGIVQTSSSRVRQHYFNSTRFYLDCLCLLPLDLLYLSIGVNSLIRLPRFVKVYKLRDFTSQSRRQSPHPTCFRMIGWIVCCLTWLHWNACFFHVALGRIAPSPALEANTTSSSFPLGTYLQSFHNSLLCLSLRNPVMNSTVDDNSDALLNCLLIFEALVGLTMLTILIANVNLVTATTQARENEFRGQLSEVRSYLRARKAPEALKRRVVCWYDYLWSQSRIPAEQRVLGFLPSRLKAEVAIHIHLNMLKRVDVFQDTEEGFLSELVLRLRPVLFSPGDFICRKGEIGREMFLISQGKLNVLAQDDVSVLTTLCPGSYFGEISILNLGTAGNRRTASVQSIGFSDLFSLSKEDLWDVLKEYPSAREKLEKVAFQRLNHARSRPNSNSTIHHDGVELTCPTDLGTYRGCPVMRPKRSYSNVSAGFRRCAIGPPLASSISAAGASPSSIPGGFVPATAPLRVGMKRGPSMLTTATSSNMIFNGGDNWMDQATNGPSLRSLSASAAATHIPLRLPRQYSLQNTASPNMDNSGGFFSGTAGAAVAFPNNPNGAIPQIRFERAATPEPVSFCSTPHRQDSEAVVSPVQFGIPEDDNDEDGGGSRVSTNQAVLLAPVPIQPMSQSDSAPQSTTTATSSLSASPSSCLHHRQTHQQSQQLGVAHLLSELQQRVAFLEGENRVLSMCMLSANRTPPLGEPSSKPSTQNFGKP